MTYGATARITRWTVALANASTPTTTPTPISLAYLAFAAPGRRQWAITNHGRIDELEWNSVSASQQLGTNRDGGLTMPTAFWESGDRRGQNRRVANVAVDRDSGSPTVRHYADWAGSGIDTQMIGRWERVGVQARGWNHRTRISLGETDDGVHTIVLRENALSDRMDK